MTYVVEALLGTASEELARGLHAGDLQRWGGIVRIARGNPGAGQIVAHLRELGGESARRLAPEMAHALQLTNVAAAASVINLGVSAVGFAVVCHKLDRLRDSVDRLQVTIEDMREDLTSRLDLVDAKLVELRYVATVNTDLLFQALDRMTVVRTEMLDDKASTLSAWANRLTRDEEDSERLLPEAIHAFDQVRLSLQPSLSRRSQAHSSEDRWPAELMRHRVWCAASAGEVNLLRRNGQLREAANVAREVAVVARGIATSWQEALMPASELGGVHRLAHSSFVTGSEASRGGARIVDREVYERLARMQACGEVERAALHSAGMNAAIQVVERAPELTKAWFERQRSAAALLDFVEEPTERLESLADEVELCERRRLGWVDWEELPPPAQEGLAIIQTKGVPA